MFAGKDDMRLPGRLEERFLGRKRKEDGVLLTIERKHRGRGRGRGRSFVDYLSRNGYLSGLPMRRREGGQEGGEQSWSMPGLVRIPYALWPQEREWKGQMAVPDTLISVSEEEQELGDEPVELITPEVERRRRGGHHPVFDWSTTSDVSTAITYFLQLSI